MASGVIIPVVRAGGAAARWVLKYFDDAKNVTKTSTHSSLGDAKKAAAKGGVGNPKVLKQGLRKEKTMSKKVVGRQSGSQVGSVPPPKPKPRIIRSGPGEPITKQEMRDFLSSSGVGDATIVGLSDTDLSKAYKSIKKRVEGRRGGGKVLYKRHGGPTNVGLSPAEEARTGTMSEARLVRYMKNGGYLKDIKPDTTWEQFKKKHPKAGITKKDFESKKPPVGLKWKKEPKFRSTYGGPVPTTREAKKGGIVSKRYGGMSEVGLHPAEEARAGTMPQMARRRPMKKGGNVYRKLGGKVTDGNDVIKMIYD